MKRATIGIKTRTGRAVAIALGEPADFICREELVLSDGRTRQPYHDVMDLPWSESIVAVRPAIAAIEKIAARELQRLIDDMHSRGYEVTGVAIVGPADRKLERIGSPHIRAHAAEGVLFRAVVEKAAETMRIKSTAFVNPSQEIGASDKKKVDAMKKIAGSPWRAEEKAAAMAALLIQRRSSAR